jgi:hypothetical protein
VALRSRPRRPKPSKLATHAALHTYVEERLAGKIALLPKKLLVDDFVVIDSITQGTTSLPAAKTPLTGSALSLASNSR